MAPRRSGNGWLKELGFQKTLEWLKGSRIYPPIHRCIQPSLRTSMRRWAARTIFGTSRIYMEVTANWHVGDVAGCFFNIVTALFNLTQFGSNPIMGWTESWTHQKKLFFLFLSWSNNQMLGRITKSLVD